MDTKVSESGFFPSDGDPQWKPLFKLAGICALIMVGMIPVQAAVYIISPPPETVLGYFSLFQQNWVLGLLDLDILLTIDNLLIVPIYLALFVTLKRTNISLALLGLVFGLIGLCLYFVSREATFTMWLLSGQYAAAATEVQKTALVGAGQTLLAIYNGSSFDLSYVLGGTVLVLFSAAMLKSGLFGKAAAVVGLVMGMMMLVPPTVGQVGMIISMISLIPTMVWLIMIGRVFLKMGKRVKV
ncbi:MAG: hypothetical protein A2Y33_06695 [Spirochaetes bacterium GWF1_51_8]|nr:MAG: hypothetical protein A2Y33_06695 [Spirochaetes bacterium GWF1_51_8]